MSNFAMLSVDTGDVLNIIRPDKQLAGGELYSFLTFYSNYDEKLSHSDSDFLWFEKIENSSSVNFRIFWNIYYSGIWDKYNYKDYELAKTHVKSRNLTREEFFDALDKFHNIWVPLSDLLSATEELIKVISDMKSTPEWVENFNLILDLQGLLGTIKIAQNRGGEEGRIKFS